jgi:hypothetical protein
MCIVFLDLGSAINKNYTHVKIVLDDALTKYVYQGGSFKTKRLTKHGIYMFLILRRLPALSSPREVIRRPITPYII